MPYPKKPTALRVMQGNPGKRPLPKGEPKPRVRLPSAPAHLSAVAKAEWKRMGKMLVSTGIMTELDSAGFGIYCTAYARWVEAEEHVAKYGMVILTPKEKFPVVSPYLSIAKGAAEQCVKLLAEFGALPASRSKVTAVAPPKQRSEMEDLLGLG